MVKNITTPSSAAGDQPKATFSGRGRPPGTTKVPRSATDRAMLEVLHEQRGNFHGAPKKYRKGAGAYNSLAAAKRVVLAFAEMSVQVGLSTIRRHWYNPRPPPPQFPRAKWPNYPISMVSAAEILWGVGVEVSPADIYKWYCDRRAKHRPPILGGLELALAYFREKRKVSQ